MAANIPKKYLDLLTTKPVLAHLSTSMKDGRPQVTPIWFSFENDLIELNSAKGRVKDINMRARPAVALSVLDPDNDFRYLQIMGTVTEVTEQGADPWRQPGEVRVIYRVTPNQVQASG